jgi:N4-gp56 family major capsid protein
MANEIVSANMAEAIVRYVANEALPVLSPMLLMANIVNRDYDTDFQQKGDVINVPIAPKMKSNNLAETGSVQNQNQNLGNVSIVLDTHREVTFSTTDIVRMLTNIDLPNTYMTSALEALAEDIENDLMSNYPGLTSNTALGANNADITEAVLDAAETSLFKARVPANDPKYLVLQADQYSKVRQISRFTEMQTSGNGAAISDGALGTIKNFRVFRSQLVPKVSSTVYNLAFARSAFVLATRRVELPPPGLGVVGAYAEANGIAARVLLSYNAGILAQTMTLDVLYGHSVLRKEFGVQVLSQ